MSIKNLCLYFFLSLSASAAEPWNLPLFTSDPRAVLAAASRYPTPEELDAIVLDYSVHLQLDDSGRMHKTTRVITRIVRLQGIQGSRQLFVPWISWRENRPKIKARVITSDGKPHLLDETTIVENALPASAGASRNLKVLSVVLPSVDMESVIELETEQSDREVGDSDGRWGEIIVNSKYFIGHFSAVIEAVPAQSLRVEVRGFREFKRSDSQSGGAQQVRIEDDSIIPSQSGILLPPEQVSAPTITFSTFKTWQSIARWYAGVIDKASSPRSTLHASAATDRVTAVESVFDDIQKKIKSVDAGLGADPYTPQTPAATLAKGSGDAKDKAVLLISRLAEIGIPAKPALLRAAPDSELLRNLPGLEAFNRMLVYVPGEHPLWIDPGAEFTPVSRLPLGDQGRWALIVDPSTTDLVRTPESSASENREIAITEIRLEDGAEAKVTATVEPHGAFEDISRSVYAAATNQEETDKLRTELVQMSRTRRITKLDTGEPRNLLTPYRLQFLAEGYVASQVTDMSASVELPGPAAIGFQQFAPLLQATAQGYTPAQILNTRKFDYYAPPAFTEENRFHLIPPPGYRLKSPPPSSPLALGPLTLSSQIKIESDGSVQVDYSLVNPKSRYTVQEVGAMLRDLQKLADKVFLRISFTNVAEEMLAGGHLKEGIASLQQDAASTPLKVNPILRLASAYARIGVRDEAIKLCQRALAVKGNENRSNAAAYARLGWIYTHDEFGRPFRPGMNMPEAETAYLKATELDPDEKSYRVELATLYTYNAAGIRYGRSARLDKALQKFREVGIANLAAYNALNDYALTLLMDKRYDEVKQFFLYPEAERASPAIKLAAIAASSGATDVKEEADFIAPALDKQKSLLADAAQDLLAAREYQAASTLFQLARVQVVKGPSEMLFQKMRFARNFDETTPSPNPAIAAFQRLTAAVLNPANPEDWKKLVVPESRDIPPARYRAELLFFVNGTPADSMDPSAWPLVSDVLTTTANFTAEGSEAFGFRIRITASPDKGARTVAYVVKRGNEYLVLGLPGSAASSGEALTRVEKGDLAGARQWLDWAKDELSPGKAPDPMASLAVERLWPSKVPATPDLIEAAAATLAARGTDYQHGITVLRQLRERTADPDLQTALDQGLAQGLLLHQQYAEVIPILQRLRAKWPNSELVGTNLAQALIATDRFEEASALIGTLERTQSTSLPPMRLREQLLAQQGKFKEAAALETRICANPKATVFDWNDLAWIDLFAQSDEKNMRDAAAKAEQLSQGRNPSVLQTVAVVQASTGQIQEARTIAYRLMDQARDPDELLTIFGRIAEQLGLRDAAAAYYHRVKKPEGNSSLSNYAFAQMRLKQLSQSVG